MSHKSGNKYPEEFKQQIVDLYHAGTPVIKLAREYGLIEQTIYKWIKLYSPIAEDDNGVAVSMKQYTSDLFEKYLLKHGIRHSFSRKGCPYDNACIESFHASLKKEEVHQKTYIESKDAFTSIFEFIESWYNRKRIHSSLNYQTPDAVYQAAIGAA